MEPKGPFMFIQSFHQPTQLFPTLINVISPKSASEEKELLVVGFWGKGVRCLFVFEDAQISLY